MNLNEIKAILDAPEFIGAIVGILLTIAVKVLHGQGVAVPWLEKLAQLWSVKPTDPKAEPAEAATPMLSPVRTVEVVIDAFGKPATTAGEQANREAALALLSSWIKENAELKRRVQQFLSQ